MIPQVISRGALLTGLSLGALLLAGCPEGPAPAVVDAGAAPAPAKAVARLESLSGQVTLERAGKSSPAAAGELLAGDALETGPGALATVSFPGGRLVEIGPDARFAINQGEGGIVLEVARGLVLSRVPADAKVAPGEPAVSLSILTPFGLTRVGSGQSEISVNVGKDAAAVEVLLGKVEFISRNGKATGAAAGDRLSAGDEGVTLTPKGPLVLETIEVTLYASAGKAEIRKKDSKAWRAVGRKGQAMAAGDALRVKEGRSTLKLEGTDSHLTLPKGAELVFEKSGRVGGVDESHVALKKGELVASLAAGKKSRVVVGGLELASDLGGQFTVIRTADGYSLLATTGDLSLKQGEQQTQVKAGQLARIAASGAASVQDVAREEIVLPSRRGLRVVHPNVGRAALSWEGEKKDYRVEVAADPDFKQPVLEGIVHEPFVNVPVPVRGALYWRVFEAAGTKELDRGSATFAPEPAAKELGRQRNEVPDGAEKTTIYYQDKPPAVTFTYRAEPKAVEYRVLVYRESALDKPVAERVVKEQAAPLEAGILAEGEYLWSVTPLSDKG
ncbi:MAG: FecR family protein, partial [Myxococcaceae bacterium]